MTPGAEAVLKLRALVSYGDFPAYRQYHLRQEHRRVHQARYQTRGLRRLVSKPLPGEVASY